MTVNKKSLLDRLRDGVVVGDGDFVIALEKRGYVKAGPVEHPEAVLQLHREFVRAGADVAQAFSYASEDNRVDKEAAALAIKAASEVEGELAPLTAGGIRPGDGKEEFKKQLRQFKDLDFLLCEYFEHIEEMEWAIQACKEVVVEEVKEGRPKKAICATMRIGPEAAGDCAVRMAKAGANVVGVSHFDPFASLETMQIMKDALEEANLLNKGELYLMCQPLADADPRWDIHKYARDAYKMGIRYIGGCCGFEPYHIRAVSEALEKDDRWDRLQRTVSRRLDRSADYIDTVVHVFESDWSPQQLREAELALKRRDKTSPFYQILMVDFDVRAHFDQVDSHRAFVLKAWERLGAHLPAVSRAQAEEHDLSKYNLAEAVGYTLRWVHGRDGSAWLESLGHHYGCQPHHPQYFTLGGRMTTEGLQESVVDMVACRWERQLQGRPDATVAELMDIAPGFLERYHPEDRKVVQQHIDSIAAS